MFDGIKLAMPWLVGLSFVPKLLVSILVVVLAIFILSLLWTNTPEEQVSSSDLVEEYSSHFSAASAGALTLDCARHFAPANPNLSTYEGRLCEAVSELRLNMMSMARTKYSINSTERKWIDPTWNFEKTARYFNMDFKDIDYGPVSEKILALIKESDETLHTISNKMSLDLYDRWATDTPMTIDDLFTVFGFLEWVIAHDSLNKSSPSELSRLGIFYNDPFDSDMTKYLSIRYFSDYAEPEVDYATLVSMFDE